MACAWVRPGLAQGRCTDWLDASERALRYYRRSGWSTSGCLSETGSAVYHGPTPVPEALEMCERLLEEATDRPGTAHVLAYLAVSTPATGAETRPFASSMKRTTCTATSRTTTAWPTRAAGSAVVSTPSRRTMRRRGGVSSCCETFERFDDAAALASVAAELGGSLSAQGRIDEARGLSALAEGRAPPATSSRSSPGGSSRQGFSRTTIDWQTRSRWLLKRCLSSMQTDALTHQGDVLLDVATVLTAAKRTGEAADHVRQAIDAYDRKQNLAAARNARARLAGAEVV